MSDNSRVRVSIVGVVIVALFASLFARVWFLQMGPEQTLGQVVSTLSTRVIQPESPLEPAVVALRIPLAQQLMIREHREDYPGVNVVELTIRSYPDDGYASQLL